VLKLSIAKKLNFYRQLKKSFEDIKFLVYFNCNCIFYININISKQHNFDTIIYYFKKRINLEKLQRIDVESILFLSQLFNSTKT